MTDFARRRQIATPAGDAEAGYLLVFDDSLRLHCFERFNSLHLVSPLGRPPEERGARRQWLRRLLNTALTFMKDAPITPMLAEDGEVALFSRLDDIDMMPMPAFEENLERHVNCLETFQREMAPEAAAKPGLAPQMMFRP